MEQVAEVAALWRYPIKSMGGERVHSLWVHARGVAGDRMLAFESAGAAKGKPLLTGAERNGMLRCSARFVPDGADAGPVPHEPVPAAARVEVTTPGGECFRADDPRLVASLRAGQSAQHPMWLRQSETPLTDCRPIALISEETLAQLSAETGTPIIAERFRPNLVLRLAAGRGFGEDSFVGRILRFGNSTTIAIRERDPRCRIITIDPATGEMLPALMKEVAHRHEGRAGIYGTAIVPGPVSVGDAVTLLD